MLKPYISSFQNGLTFPPIPNGCWVMTRQSWLLRALFAENVWKNWLKNSLFVSGKVILLAPDHSWSPIFGIVVPFYEFYKRYLGFLRFWVYGRIFGRSRSKNWLFFQKKANFSTSSPQNLGQKFQNLKNSQIMFV